MSPRCAVWANTWTSACAAGVVFAALLASCSSTSATSPTEAIALDASPDDGAAASDSPTADVDAVSPAPGGGVDLDDAALFSHAWAVDPLIGTAFTLVNIGSTIPGATVPFGLVKCSPDTSNDAGMGGTFHCAGYQRMDPYIHAFSHNHLQGTGAPDYGNVAVLPFATAGHQLTSRAGRRSAFSHTTEQAKAGYYAATLDGPGARHELTATAHCGVHRTVFVGGAKAGGLLIDLSEAIAGGRVTAAEVKLDPKTQMVRGRLHNWGDFSGRYGGFDVFFTARFSRPWSAAGTWNGTALSPGSVSASQPEPPAGLDRVNLGMYAQFDTSDLQPTELQVCLSYVDAAGADQNWQAEVAGKNFDQVRQQALQVWESELSRVDIGGATPAERTVYYSALYRAMSMPTLWSDVDGRYRGFDGQNHQAQGWKYYTDLSLWDTFRTAHPLYALLFAEFTRDVMRSLAAMAQQGGCLPQWAMGGGDTGSMIGQHAVSAAADAVAKGIVDFDVAGVYAAGKAELLAPPGGPCSAKLECAEPFNQRGWCALQESKGSVSVTLEYAWNAACMATLAQYLGLPEDVTQWQSKALNYKQLWDSDSQLIRPRNLDGSWQAPFDTLAWDFGNTFYVEGTAWQWNWFAPQDYAGVIGLYPSTDAFVAKLSSFFQQAKDSFKFALPGAFYFHGNEPDILASAMFLAAGRVDLADQWTRWVYDSCYSTAPDGLVGNDDAGTLSAWAVLAGIGLYPRPGAAGWDLVAPRFDQTTVRLGDKTLTILASGVHDGAQLGPSVLWQGQPLPGRWIGHGALSQGGTLQFGAGSP